MRLKKRKRMVSDIYANILNHNFKFAWSVCEMKNAFLEGIFALNGPIKSVLEKNGVKQMSKIYRFIYLRDELL